MKKIITFLVIGMMVSCSVEEIENQPIDQIDQNYVVALNGECIEDVLNFPEGGSVAVTNDNDNIYLSVSANSGYELSKVRFQVSESISDFPTENNGSLNPQKLTSINSFKKGVTNHTFSVEKTSNAEVNIAINVTFKRKSGPTVSGWAGESSGGNGSWKYFKYTICAEQSDPCAGITAGEDKIKVLTLSEAKAIPNADKVKKLYLSLLDSGVPLNGTFDPTILEIIDAFDSEGSGGIIGDYTTTYTITEGDCSDSVNLTVRIVADPIISDPVCELDAGEDNMITLTLTEAKAIPNIDKVTKLYLSLLDPSVPQNGSFDPTIWDIIKAFGSYKGGSGVLGDYTTTYTVTDGECSDSVELTIRVIAD